MHESTNNLTAPSESEVRQRILKSAEDFFARKGFDATSIRDITSAAECNVAAVNYHFGSKEKLYQEVFRQHFDVLRDSRIASIRKVMSEAGENLTLETLLQAFAVAFLDPFLDRSTGKTLVHMFLRELSDPRLPANQFSDEVMIPVHTVLSESISRVCPELDARDSQKCIHSLIGQLVHFVQVHDYFSRIENLDGKPMIHLNEMIQHAVQFTAAGIRSYMENDR